MESLEKVENLSTYPGKGGVILYEKIEWTVFVQEIICPTCFYKKITGPVSVYVKTKSFSNYLVSFNTKI